MLGRTSLLIAIAIVLIGACGDDDAGDPSGEIGLPVPEPVCISSEEDLLVEYEGVREAEALQEAAEQGLDVREVGRDGQCFAVDGDRRDDRLNLEIVEGLVVGAAIY